MPSGQLRRQKFCGFAGDSLLSAVSGVSTEALCVYFLHRRPEPPVVPLPFVPLHFEKDVAQDATVPNCSSRNRANPLNPSKPLISYPELCHRLRPFSNLIALSLAFTSNTSGCSCTLGNKPIPTALLIAFAIFR